MCAAYAFARRVDDIGDGALEREEKLRGLDAQASALSDMDGQGGLAAPEDPVVLARAFTDWLQTDRATRVHS